MDRLIGVFAAILGLSGLLLTFVGLSDDILKNYPFFVQYRSQVMTTGIVLFVVSILLLTWLMVLIIKVIAENAENIIKGMPESFPHGFTVTDASEAQLDIAYKFIVDLLKHEGIGVAQMLEFERFRSLWKKNQTVYRLLWDARHTSEPKLAGFICIFPLSRSAAGQVLDGTLRGNVFDSAHLASKWESAHAYFVGAIAATSPKAKGQMLIVLHHEIAQLSLSGRAPQLYFTSPFTYDGRRTARDFGFRIHYKYRDGAELWIRTTPPSISKQR